MMDEDVHVPAALVVASKQARLVAFVDGKLQRLALADILAADVDVGRVRAHRKTGDHAALDQRERVVAHDFPVLAGPGSDSSALTTR